MNKKDQRVRDFLRMRTPFTYSAQNNMRPSLKDITIATKLVNEAIKAASGSHHHLYRVGSSAYSRDPITGESQFSAFANKIPSKLRRIHPQKEGDPNFEPNNPAITKIGNGHPTVHGEFRALYLTPCQRLGSNTCNCGNCAKLITLRDQEAIYIDRAALPGEPGRGGKDNAWNTSDRSKLWEDVSLKMFKAAGIPVYAVFDKNDMQNTRNKISLKSAGLVCLNEGLPPEQRPKPQYPAEIFTRKQLQRAIMANPKKFFGVEDGVQRVLACARNTEGKKYYIFARDTFPAGITEEEGKALNESLRGKKYNFTIDPISHVAMTAANQGLKLDDGRIVANYIPEGARQLELAYVGISHIHIAEKHIEPTPEAFDAMLALQKHGLIQYNTVAQEIAFETVIQPSTKRLQNQPCISPQKN